MGALEMDSFLSTLENKRGGIKTHGIDMARQMPFYGLYDDFINHRIENGDKPSRWKDYQHYSIGFLTRRCYRHCPFCVNRLENGVIPYSHLEWFHDPSRKHVYFWDDNFLASPYTVWKPILQGLIDKRISFQFRQGLDIRQLVESEHGEEMAMMLSQCRYHGDVIFAFDNWKDRDLIEQALKVWRKHNPKKSTKLYLFTGFLQKANDRKRFYRDIVELFSRMRVIGQYGCLGYVMRHEDYKQAPISNLYTQIARWANQPAIYKKMTFWQFCYREQSVWEQKHLPHLNRPNLMTFEEFECEMASGFYEHTSKMCLPLRTLLETLAMFPEHREELLSMWNEHPLASK